MTSHTGEASPHEQGLRGQEGGACGWRESAQEKETDCAKASEVPGLFMAVKSSAAGWEEGSRREDGGCPMSPISE